MKRGEVLIFEDETKEIIFKKFEDILVEDKCGEVKKLVLDEDKKTMIFYDSSDSPLLTMVFNKNHDWMPLQFYVQSICDYYQRNLGQDKFMISFDCKEEDNVYI